MTNIMADLATRWGPSKRAAEQFLNLSPNTLHLLVGFGLLLALALATGRRLDDGRLWLVVLAIELANEAVDMSTPEGPEVYWLYSLNDVIVTMAIPTALLLFLRWTDRRAPQADASADSASEANSADPSVDG